MMLLRDVERRNSPRVWELVARNTVDLWIELSRRYRVLRGESEGRNRKGVPRTTVADVKLIAARWSVELAKVPASTEVDRGEESRWRRCMDEVRAQSEGLAADAVYPGNARFWQECTRRLAIYLDSRRVRPSRWQLFSESVVESLAEVPGVAGRATRIAAGAAASVLRDPARLAAVLLGAAILLPPLIRGMRS